MTMRSYPRLVGMVLTRMSKPLPAIFFAMRPSCGRRFSAMLSELSILMRLTMLLMNARGARRAT
jgi:hypothetical protein